MPAKGKGRAKAAAGHQHASALQKGIEMKDLRKKSWFLGEPVGSGGFGLLYLADSKKDCIGQDKAEFVIKVEPRANGPLFCELAFYQRAAKPECLAAWKKSSRLSYVGIPPYIAHGLHENGGENLRFMVMPRYGCDLHSLWLKAKKRFSRATVCQLAIELINSLEYMHANEYVHADVKGSNVLLGHEDPNQIFLVDFGLAYRYVVDGKHKEYQEDPRKAHDGTIEYTSRDAHLGVSPSRRSDLEILGYVLLHWLSGKLPWEHNLKDQNYVKGQKIKHMKKVKQFVTSVYPDANKANEIEKFLQDVSKLEYDEQPNYDLLRKYFQDALDSMGVPLKSKINFDIPETSTQIKKMKRSAQPKEKSLESDDEEDVTPKKRARKSSAKRNQVSSSPKEDLSSMKSTTTSEEAPPSISANNSRSLQSNKEVKLIPKKQARKSPAKRKQVLSSSKEDLSIKSTVSSEEAPSLQSNKEVKLIPKKRARKSPAERKQVLSSPKEDLSSIKSTASSEETPVKTSYARKKAVSSVKKTAPKRARKQKRRASPEISSDEAESEKPVRSKKRVRTKKSEALTENGPSSSAITEDEEVNVIDSTFSSGSPVQKRDTRSSLAKQKGLLKKNSPKKNIVSSPSIAKSRYSMAPLHTKSVLAKDDSLSGKYLGKHPVIIRRRKVKRPKTDAVTQTTPSLRSRLSRVNGSAHTGLAMLHANGQIDTFLEV